MKSEAFIRATLWMSSIFNFFAAYVFAAPSSYLGNIFEFPQNVPPLYAGLTAFFITAFGVVYAWLARQANLAQPLLFVGGAGKVCVFFLILTAWVLGEASGKITALAIGDLVFGSLWLWWLLATRTSAHA